MSTTAVLLMTALATAITFAWARLMGESAKVSAVAALACGFVIPWGVATLLWLAFGGRIA